MFCEWPKAPQTGSSGARLRGPYFLPLPYTASLFRKGNVWIILKKKKKKSLMVINLVHPTSILQMGKLRPREAGGSPAARRQVSVERELGSASNVGDLHRAEAERGRWVGGTGVWRRQLPGEAPLCSAGSTSTELVAGDRQARGARRASGPLWDS